MNSRKIVIRAMLGMVEEQLRGVIRLTALGYKKYKNAPLPYADAG
jgi:hypothetical protein